jgi:hypothetical protein
MEGRGPMPLELEIGLLSKNFNTTPGAFGFDNQNVQFIRTVRGCMTVYDAVVGQRQARDKNEWRNNNPDMVRFISKVRSGESDNPDPNEVKVELPERPARRRR